MLADQDKFFTKAIQAKILQMGKFPQVKWIKIFGSRARGDAREYSDFDIAIKFSNKPTSAQFMDLQEFISDADLYQKDIVDYDEADKNLKASIDGQGIVMFIDKPWYISFIKLKNAVFSFKKFLNKKLADDDLDGHEMKRMAVIFSFIFVTELFWKFFKQHLENEELISATNPRQSFEKAFAEGWIDDAKAWSDMLKDRNDAVHSYNESVATAIYQNIQSYIPKMEKAFELIEKMVNKEAENYAS